MVHCVLYTVTSYRSVMIYCCILGVVSEDISVSRMGRMQAARSALLCFHREIECV